MRPLRFYDYHRQSYSVNLPIKTAGQFMIGDYPDEGGGVSEDGEFQVDLHDFSSDAGLSVQVCAFGDSTGSLRRAIEAGLLDAMVKNVRDSDEFSRRLLDLGMVDVSERPLPAVEHKLVGVVSHFIHGTQADCTCGWSSEYVDTGNALADVKTAMRDHEAHVAEPSTGSEKPHAKDLNAEVYIYDPASGDHVPIDVVQSFRHGRKLVLVPGNAEDADRGQS